QRLTHTRRDVTQRQLRHRRPRRLKETHLVLAERQKEKMPTEREQRQQRTEPELVAHHHILRQRDRHAIQPLTLRRHEQSQAIGLMTPEILVAQHVGRRREETLHFPVAQPDRTELLLSSVQQVTETDGVLPGLRASPMGGHEQRKAWTV